MQRTLKTKAGRVVVLPTPEEDAAITADREIRVQLEELGYLSSTGRVLKPIVMPDSGN